MIEHRLALGDLAQGLKFPVPDFRKPPGDKRVTTPR
jgi:hypothetical protein